MSATCPTSEAEVEELIPGLPNDVTVGSITTKLSIVDVDKLATVNRGWCNAIRSRKVYDARVHFNSTQTVRLAVRGANIRYPKDVALVLYPIACNPKVRLILPPLRSDCYARQVRRSDCYARQVRLKRFDGFRCHFRVDAFRIQKLHRVNLDGKVYVLCGRHGKMHVLDVAGHRQWKQCADVLKPKLDLGCGVIAGQLYVHGGGVDYDFGCTTELYNPTENVWTEIKTIVPLRSSRHAGRKPQEVFWHIGILWPMDPSDVQNEDPLEIYDPVKDEWRVVEPVGTPKERIFLARGEFYSVSPRGIQIYDFHGNSWGDLHFFSFAAIAPVDPCEISPVASLTVDGELLAVVGWHSAGRYRSCLVQSRGLGSQNKKIVWQKPDYSDKYFPPRPVVKRICSDYIRI